jgi:hypothetical protein
MRSQIAFRRGKLGAFRQRALAFKPLFPAAESVLLLPATRTTSAMNLQEATKLIRQCAERMDALYGNTVFDEWAVIAIQEKKGRILNYSGPRRTDFQKNFAADEEDFIALLLSGTHGSGDFEFARHGVGTKADAFMVLGRRIYLICNNTRQSMEQITQNPLWLQAQVPFAELGDKFRADPITTQG